MTAARPPWIREAPGGVDVLLHVQPRASRTQTAGTHGDALKIQVAAPPVDGEANAALLAYFSRALGLPGARVELLAGEGSRRKRVRLLGLAVDEVLRALEGGGH
jgi:uncharacterized protein (TIGR00251 family)